MRARSRSAQTPRSLATRLWTRVCTGRSEYGRRSIESEYTAFQFGYDRQIQPGLRAGGALSYRDGSNDIASGKGDSSIAAFTSYATKLFDNGAFLDGTFKFGRTDNEFDIASEAGRAKGDYDANMFSFSIEAGIASILSRASSSSLRSNSCTAESRASTTRPPRATP